MEADEWVLRYLDRQIIITTHMVQRGYGDELLLKELKIRRNELAEKLKEIS